MKTQEEKRLYQRHWHNAAYAKNPDKFKDRSRERHQLLGSVINQQNRSRSAERRTRERAAKWALYQQNPPAKDSLWNEQLKFWFEAQPLFLNKRQFARAVPVSVRAVMDWFRGKHPPVRGHRRKLYELTGLPCFADAADLATPLKELLAAATEYIESLPSSPNTKNQYRNFCDRILERLTQRRITSIGDVIPTSVFQSAPGYVSKKAERHALGFFGRFMAERGLWNEKQHAAFEGLLTQHYPLKYQASQSTVTSKVGTSAAGPLLIDLVINCGLTIAQASRLQVADCTPEGISVMNRRMLPYGEGLHHVRKKLVEEWIAEAGLTSERTLDFLFYQRTPRAASKPAGRAWIAKQMRSAGASSRGRSWPNMRHFEMDYEQFQSPLGLRLHLQIVHGMSKNRSAELIRELQRRLGIHLPRPYLAAIVAVAQLSDCTPKKIPGGRALSYTWPDLNGYEIEVQWPASFVDEMLKDGRVKPGIARELIRLALESCGEKTKIQGGGFFRNLDPLLAEKLSLIRVTVRDAKNNHVWRGAVLNRSVSLRLERVTKSGKRRTFRLRRSSKSRRFSLQILEALQGGPSNGRCYVCRHVERMSIDDEVRAGQKLSVVAKHYCIPYSPSEHHLLWHAGRLKDKAAHVASGPRAASARVPSNFLFRVAKENAANLAREVLALR